VDVGYNIVCWLTKAAPKEAPQALVVLTLTPTLAQALTRIHAVSCQCQQLKRLLLLLLVLLLVLLVLPVDPAVSAVVERDGNNDSVMSRRVLLTVLLRAGRSGDPARIYVVTGEIVRHGV
jgi:hypothetical protein